MTIGVSVTFTTSYSTPSMTTVTFPVAFSGKSTLIVLFTTSTSTETSGSTWTFTVNEALLEVLAKYLSLPANAALIM